MGMKKAETATLVAETVLSAKTEAQAESGATAAIERLSKPKLTEKTTNPTYKQRDPDATARRILVQGSYQQATVSPSLAGLRFDDLAGFQKHVEEHAQWLIARVEAQS